MMKQSFKAVAACLVAAMALQARADVEQPESFLLDGVAASVNRRFVMIGEVMEVMAPAAAQLRRHHRGAALEQQLAEASRQALSHLIERALILEDYQGGEQPIPERWLQNRIREITFERFGRDREAVWHKLAETGVTLEEWRRQLREGIIVSYLRDMAIESRIAVSPGEVRQFYTDSIARFRTGPRVWLRAIMLRNGDGDTARSELAAALRSRLQKGEDFESLAREYSEGRLAEKGGDWGWLPVEELRSELAVPALELPVGDFSDVITVNAHYYIIQVKGRRMERVAPLAEVYDEIMLELRQQQAERLRARWMERLESAAAVHLWEDVF